jgi:hypothetical protein
MVPIVVRFDVSDAIGEQASLAATYYPVDRRRHQG